MNTAAAARGHWEMILKHFGVDELFLRNAHGPCPLCGGKDRFRFDNKGGDGTYYCSQCGAGNGFTLLQSLTGKEFKVLAREVDALVRRTPDCEKPAPKKACQREKLIKVGGALQHIEGVSPVTQYLAARHIGVTSCAYLRLHKGIKYYDQGKCLGEFPALVAACVSAEGKTESFHITYLTKDGRKARVPSPRKFMTPLNGLTGCSIRLSPVHPHIGIAEGIETAIACRNMFDVPCWASGNAHLMEKFIVPPGVRKVTIFADNDANFTGQKAAYMLANRLIVRDKIEALVVVPEIVGTDYADFPQGAG